MAHVLKELVQWPISYITLITLILLIMFIRKKYKITLIVVFLLIMAVFFTTTMGSKIALHSLVMINDIERCPELDTWVLLPAGVDVYSESEPRPEFFGLQRGRYIAEKWMKNRNSKIVIPGDKSSNETLVYRAYLEKQGVPSSHIVLLPGSNTTHKNLMDIHGAGYQNITIFTSDWHAYRAKKTAKLLNNNWCVESIPTQLNMSLVPSFRGHWATKAAIHEWMGIAWYKLTKRNK